MLVADEQHETRRQCGSIAQLGEHLPYKQGVTGSSPVVPTKFWPGSSVGQNASLSRQRSSVRTRSGSPKFASVAQSVEQGTENPRVIGSIPIGGTKNRYTRVCRICGRSSSGRAPPCQGGGSGFEPRHPLQYPKHHMGAFSFVIFYLQLHILYHKALQPSGKAGVCKTPIPQFKSE